MRREFLTEMGMADGANIELSNILGILRTRVERGRWSKGCEVSLLQQGDCRGRRQAHEAACVLRSLDFILQQMGHQYRSKEK